MRVTVHYFAQLRRAAGCASEALALEPGTTLRGLCHRLAQTHEGMFRDLLLDRNGDPSPTLLVFVGDQPADFGRVLGDGEAVTILTPMAGG